MQNTQYLIVGGGLTGDAACRGIRALDPDGRIVLVGEEPQPPYARPPLSKGLWRGDNESTIWCGTADLGVDLKLGRRVVGLDLERREARDDHDETYAYEKLLLATGGRPRRLPFGGDEVVYFRTLVDYQRLHALADAGARFVVIGGGFIGSEIAAALATNGNPVTMVFPGPGIGASIFPRRLSAALVDYYRVRGVTVLPEVSVTSVERRGNRTRVVLGGGRTLEAEAVVAGVGIEPNVTLAIDAGLPVSNGIVVDALGRIGGHQDVFAAGDVACFPIAALRRVARVEHEDHAKTHGRSVGANMAGAAKPYDYLPFFYSDLFDLGYEAVGELDARLNTFIELSALHEKGMVCYLDDEHRPRGFLFWNLFGRLDEARDLIRAGEPVTPGAPRARLTAALLRP
jgi:NADPH-dependent 2,4-dienoyl-CoA reductase/sulfur reductase-like enzyme